MNLQDLVVNLKLVATEFMDGLKSATSAFEKHSGDMLKAGAVLSAGVTAPIVGLGSAAMSMASQLQSAEIGFTTMLGSAQEAGAFLEELKDFAAKTPFEFKDLTEAAKRMMALGFAAKDVVPMMTAVGNAAAGLGGGSELINRITLALGQMSAKGKVSAEEMRQLAEAGIPAWKALADSIGVSIPEAMKMAEKGAISAAEAIPAIIEGMNNRFGGMMENFSQTVMGRWSNLKDQLGYILADIGKSIMPIANMILEKVVLPAGEMLKTLVEKFAALPDPIKMAGVAFAGLVAAIGPLLLAAGGLMTTLGPLFAEGALLGAGGAAAAALSGLSALLPPIAIAIAAVAAAWGLWQLEPVRNAVMAIWEVLSGFWNDTLKPFLETLYALGTAFVKVAGEVVGSALVAYFESLWQGAKNLADGAVWLYEKLGELWDWISSGLSVFEPLWDIIVKVTEVVALLAAALVVAAFETAINTFKALGVAFEVVWELAKGLGEILMDVLLEAIKQLFGPTVALYEMLGGPVFKVLGAEVQAVAKFFKEYLGPALDWVIERLKDLLGWMAKLPGVKTAIDAVSGAFENMKDRVTAAMSGTAEATSKVPPTLAELKTQADAAQKTVAELYAKLENGQRVDEELAAAQKKLIESNKALDAAVKASGLSIESASKKVDAAGKTYQEAKKAYEDLKKANDSTASGMEKLKAALNNVKRSGDALVAAQKEMKLATELASKTTDEHTASKKRGVDATAKLETAEKALKKEVQALELAYREAIRTSDGTEASIKRITDAQTKLQEAQDKLHPEKVAERVAKGWDDAEKRNDQALKEYEKLIADVAKLNTDLAKADAALAKQSLDTANDFAKAHEQISKIAQQPIKITVKLDDQITPQMKELLKNAQELEAALKRAGVTSSAELNKAAQQAAKDAETIYEAYKRGEVGAREVLEAKKKVLEAEIAAARAAGEKITKAQEDELEKVNDALEKYGQKQVGTWQKIGQQISTIVNDFAKDISKGLMDLFVGSSRAENNKKLEEQTQDLQKSLEDRAAEWQAYQDDVAEKVEQARDKYATALANEEADLNASLEERRNAYLEAQDEMLYRIDELRYAMADELASELADLQSALADKREAYNEYVTEVSTKLDDIRAAHAEKLQEQLSDLQDALQEKAQAYSDYVTDVRKDLARLTEDYQDNIEDEVRDTNRGIADKQKAYDRAQEDTLQRIKEIKEAGKEDADQDIADLQKSLARKKEDLDDYIKRAGEDLDEYVSDQQRRLLREEEDLKASLEKRTKEWDAYNVASMAKRGDLLAANQASLAREETALQESLAKRTLEWNKYQTENYAKVTAANERYASQLAIEEEKLRESLRKKQQALLAYEAQVAEKREQTRLKYEEALAKEEAALAASLAREQQEYEKFVAAANAKIAELGESFRTFGDDLKTFFSDAFKSAGEAAFRVINEVLFGKLIDVLKGPIVDAIDWMAGKLVDVFKGPISAAIDWVAQKLLGLFGGAGDMALDVTMNAVGGGVGNAVGAGVGSAAGGVAGGVMQGVVGAVTSIGSLVTGIISNFQGMGMNKILDLIEKEARESKIHLGYILDKVNAHLPGIDTLTQDIYYGQLLGAGGVYGQMLTALEGIDENAGKLDLMHTVITNDLVPGLDRVQEYLGDVARKLGGEGSIVMALENVDAAVRGQLTKLESIAEYTYNTSNDIDSIYRGLGDVERELDRGSIVRSLDRIGDLLRDSSRPSQITINVPVQTNVSAMAIAQTVAAQLRAQGVRA